MLLLISLGAVLFFAIGPGREGFRPSPSGTTGDEFGEQRLYLPTGPSDQVLHHRFYSLGYEEDWEQPRWVAYHLTPAHLSSPRVRRSDDYRPDPAVRTGSAQRADYRRSGYSRGHLVPAGDMTFDEDAMSETFYYSNIAPQLAVHNGAVWRELEETVRDWVRAKGPAFIVTGPLVSATAAQIGSNGVSVPEAFYKVVLTESGKGVGFFISHELQTLPLTAFAKTIDEVEELSGLDFFPELEHLATPAVESHYDPTDWPFNERRYHRRLESWNNIN